MGNTRKRPGRKLESYKELFMLQDKCHILLFGDAGTGKTTQISRIAYDWARCVVEALSRIELVFVLDIRNFQSNQTLSEAIKRHLLPAASTDDVDQVLEYLENKCLILLDGYDELPRGIVNHPLTNLPLDLFVMVTGRPHITDQFCRDQIGYTQVQVSGFSKENVSVYINRFFQKEKSNLASSLVQKVNETPLLQTLSSYPVLLVMICLLWEKRYKSHDPFDSMTRLYEKAVSDYINKPFDDNKHAFEEQVLVTIGKTALDELFANNIQIEEGRFDSKDIVKKALEMGLLVCEEGKLVDDRSVSFIHKTFQEYCAAVYLSSIYDSNQEEFENYLRKVNDGNIHEMIYLWRFTCGLCLNAAAATFAHVHVSLENESADSESQSSTWNSYVTLLYETELSHHVNVENKYHSQLQATPSSGIKVQSEELLAAFHHFGRPNCTNQCAKTTWLGAITSIEIATMVHSLLALVETLSGMSSLESAKLYVARDYVVTDELVGNPDILCQSLKTFEMFANAAGRAVRVNVITLVGLFSCMPALTKVLLDGIQLTGELGGNPVRLSQSLNEFYMYGGLRRLVGVSVSVMNHVRLLSCMPALTTVALGGIQLTGELVGNPVRLSQSLKEFYMYGLIRAMSVSVMSLVGLLSSMPALTKVSLDLIKLTGEFDGNPVILSQSLTEFDMSSRVRLRVNVVTLVGLLSYMPALTKVLLDGIQLTGVLVGNPVRLSQSLKEFHLSKGFVRGVSVSAMSLVGLLSCMPALTKVSLDDIKLTGELDSVQMGHSFPENKEHLQRYFRKHFPTCDIDMTFNTAYDSDDDTDNDTDDDTDGDVT